MKYRRTYMDLGKKLKLYLLGAYFLASLGYLQSANANWFGQQITVPGHLCGQCFHDDWFGSVMASSQIIGQLTGTQHIYRSPFSYDPSYAHPFMQQGPYASWIPNGWWYAPRKGSHNAKNKRKKRKTRFKSLRDKKESKSKKTTSLKKSAPVVTSIPDPIRNIGIDGENTDEIWGEIVLSPSPVLVAPIPTFTDTEIKIKQEDELVIVEVVENGFVLGRATPPYPPDSTIKKDATPAGPASDDETVEVTDTEGDGECTTCQDETIPISSDQEKMSQNMSKIACLNEKFPRSQKDKDYINSNDPSEKKVANCIQAGLSDLEVSNTFSYGACGAAGVKMCKQNDDYVNTIAEQIIETEKCLGIPKNDLLRIINHESRYQLFARGRDGNSTGNAQMSIQSRSAGAELIRALGQEPDKSPDEKGIYTGIYNPATGKITRNNIDQISKHLIKSGESCENIEKIISEVNSIKFDRAINSDQAERLVCGPKRAQKGDPENISGEDHNSIKSALLKNIYFAGLTYRVNVDHYFSRIMGKVNKDGSYSGGNKPSWMNEDCPVHKLNESQMNSLKRGIGLMGHHIKVSAAMGFMCFYIQEQLESKTVSELNFDLDVNSEFFKHQSIYFPHQTGKKSPLEGETKALVASLTNKSEDTLTTLGEYIGAMINDADRVGKKLGAGGPQCGF
ncbi:MAG: hypothetical protein AB8E15_10615 [Bdellovibrionales bacterium]